MYLVLGKLYEIIFMLTNVLYGIAMIIIIICCNLLFCVLLVVIVKAKNKITNIYIQKRLETKIIIVLERHKWWSPHIHIKST